MRSRSGAPGSGYASLRPARVGGFSMPDAHTTPSPRARGQSMSARWATAISRRWPISSMARRSLSPRTIVPRLEASVIGRLVNWQLEPR